MLLDELNPYVRYCATHYHYNRQSENSICYDCRLFFVAEGEGSFVANGQSYNVSHGFCAFLPPRTEYKFNFKTDGVKIYVINFDLTDEFSELSESLGTATESDFSPDKLILYPLPPELSEPIISYDGLSVEGHAEACAELFLKKLDYFRHSASAHLKLALIELLCESKGKHSGYKLIRSIGEYVRSNYRDPDLTNNSIAEVFNYHPYHLNRLMRAHTGKTLHGYLTDYRLHIAKNLLKTTRLNVTSVAERCGFSSYTYFIRLFHKEMGVSPLQYRKGCRGAAL